MLKSFYIFASGLLGTLLFLVIDRVIVFIYLYLVATGYLSNSFDYGQFAVADYFVLIVVIMLGGWYGVWLGMNWFNMVYEQNTHGGFVDHIAKNIWPSRRKLSLEAKMDRVRERIEQNLSHMEDLAETSLALPEKEALRVRRVVRRATKRASSK